MKEKVLRDTQIRNMHELGQMKRAQELRVDEVSVQKLRENHETIQKLTSQLQEMHEQINSMNDAGEFQEVESNYSGRLSYVSSQPAMIPSSRSMLSRDKRLPLDAWNTSGLQENVFGNQFSTFGSLRDHPQGIHLCETPREQGSVPQAAGTGTLFTREDKQNRGTIPMPTFAGRWIFRRILWSDSKDNKFFGVAIRQHSMIHNHSLFGKKIRFKNQVTTCSDFPSEAMLWIKDVEMVDSVDDLKSSRSVSGKNFPNFEMQDAKIASSLNKIIQNSQFKRKVSLEEQKAQKEDWFLRGRQIAYLIYDYFRVTGTHDSVENYADLFTISLRNDDIQQFDSKWDGILLSMTKIPPDDILEGLYKLRIRESEKTQDRIGIV